MSMSLDKTACGRAQHQSQLQVSPNDSQNHDSATTTSSYDNFALLLEFKFVPSTSYTPFLLVWLRSFLHKRGVVVCTSMMMRDLDTLYSIDSSNVYKHIRLKLHVLVIDCNSLTESD